VIDKLYFHAYFKHDASQFLNGGPFVNYSEALQYARSAPRTPAILSVELEFTLEAAPADVMANPSC
jgi:hypothetical protein